MKFVQYVFLLGLVVGGYFWVGAVTLAAFFAIGSWPFLGILALAVALTWFAEANEEGVWAAVPFAAFCLFVHFVSQFNLWEYSKENLGYLASRGGIYLAAGFVYAIFRWLLHLNRKTRELDVLVAQFRAVIPFDGTLENAGEDIRFRFAEFLKGKYSPDLKGNTRYDYEPGVEGVVPQFGHNRFTFFRWFWWWPFSLIGWAVNDLIREIWNVIKQGLEGVANRLSALVFGARANYVLTDAQTRANQRRREEEARRGTGTTARPGRQTRLVGEVGDEEAPEVS